MRSQSEVKKAARWVVSFLALLLFSMAVKTSAQSLALVPKNYDANKTAYGAAAADLNGDGFSDFVVGTNIDKVTVYLGKGDGTFNLPVRYYVAGPAVGMSQIRIVDINLDGKLDLSVADGNWVYFLLGRGDGTFQFVTPADYHISPGVGAVVADFDHDGKPDVAGVLGNNVSIALGNGDGTFREQQVTYRVEGDHRTPDTGANPVAAVDVNADGKVDLVTANCFDGILNNGNSVSVLIGNGNGTFRPMVNYPAGSYPYSVMPFDTNNDGAVDLAVTNPGTNSIGILLGNGDGTFRPMVSYRAGKFPIGIANADMDGDGLVDVIVTNRECLACSGKVNILRGFGDGTFRSPVTFTSSPTGNAQSIATADFDRDGKLDLAVGNNQTASVLRNSRLPGENPIDASDFFVRQQYFDFLQREPDQAGLNYWKGLITSCNTDTDCIREQRVTVSAAFFVEPELQERSSFIYRFYRAALDRRPTFQELMEQRATLAGFTSRFGLSTAQDMFVTDKMSFIEFLNVYPASLSNYQFVNKLFTKAGLTPYSARSQAYVDAMNQGATRSTIVKNVMNEPDFKARVYNASFVLMQYFDYLRREPDEAGYNFWLNVLNAQPTNYRGMVCSFITSSEYQLQFGPVVTHSNAECQP